MNHKKTKEPTLGPQRSKDNSIQERDRFTFTDEHVREWGKRNLMPTELVAGFLTRLNNGKEEYKRLQEYKKNNPNASTEQVFQEVFGIPRVLSEEETQSINEDLKNSLKFHEFLEKNWEKLTTQEDNEDTRLFKTIEDKDFGISRMIADQMNHLPSLLDNMQVDQVGQNEFMIKAERTLKKEGEKRLFFSHPITAQNQQDANEIAKAIKEKLLGIRHKMWQACWLYANRVKKTNFTAPINELMKACYPNREAQFSAKDKEKFYEELRLLRLAEFTISWESTEKKKSTVARYKLNIPLLRVGGSMTEPGFPDGPPNEVMLDLCAITPIPTKKDKMRWVGAPIKKRSLELIADDCGLSFFLQLRKNQDSAGKEIGKSDFLIEQLIEHSGLRGTFESNPTVGRKRLFEKLNRAQEKDIFKRFEHKKERESVRIFW